VQVHRYKERSFYNPPYLRAFANSPVKFRSSRKARKGPERFALKSDLCLSSKLNAHALRQRILASQENRLRNHPYFFDNYQYFFSFHFSRFSPDCFKTLLSVPGGISCPVRKSLQCLLMGVCIAGDHLWFG
jgi:hypothetical protein